MGRKLSFDVEAALDAAMQVFWAKGYDGATLDDLTTAIGVNRPSVYHCFGNKAELFRQVFRRYEMKKLGFVWRALEQRSAFNVVADFVFGFLDVATDPATPNGCLGLNAAACGSADGEPVRRLIQMRRDAYRAALCQRFERARWEGDLPNSRNPIELADFVLMLVSGLAWQARTGASKASLDAALRVALAAFRCGDR